MPTFRTLPLPAGVNGTLYLHSMPGRKEDMDTFLAAAAAHKLDAILSLAGMDEIQARIPGYAKVLNEGTLPCSWKAFAVPDYKAPSDEQAFKAFILEVAGELGAGKRLLLHCGAGIGRTGMAAACVLIALVIPADQADKTVRKAGSGAERPEQQSLVQRFSQL
jgi:atypical dual specificity phosphatase